MIDKVTVPGPIELDQLHGAAAPVQVVFVDGDRLVSPEHPPRDPHRHDYHELFLVEAGTTEHLIDGEVVVAAAGQVLMIGRGKVHTLTAASGFRGAVVRFGDELLTGAAQEASPGWLLVSATSCVVEPPQRELAHALALLQLLADELQRPPDPGTDQLVTGSLAVLLTLVLRWQAGIATESPAAGNASDVALMRSFVRLLEAEHHRHHDASWYASQLAVSPSHLAAILTRLTGRSTKRLVTERLMTEVARLLRFTDLPIQQVAHRLGYDDPLYLSRAFKVHAGMSPSAWRERLRR